MSEHVEQLRASRSQDVTWWRSFVLRFTAVYVAATVLLVGVAAWQLHEHLRAEVVGKFGLALESVAGTAAPRIDAADVQAIEDDVDASKPPFQRVRSTLAEVRRINHLEQDQVYILRPVDGEPHAYEFVAMLQKRTFVGDVYRPPPKVRDRYQWVLKHGDAVRTPLYTDPNGSFISGLAPIVDDEGQTVAILQVDYGVDRYLAEVDRQTRRLVYGAAGFVFALLCLGVVVYLMMRRKVREVLRGTRAIEEQRYDHEIRVRGQDELSTIGRALNDVIRRLKERFEMLKFLPRHTTRMIEEASERGSVGLDIGWRVRVAVLESDIRGFTTLSERLPPERVIALLNHYIRVQANIVESEDGSVDKFIGDAVLAVFEGDDAELRAVRAALAIQREVERLNVEDPFEVPVHIGIGLSVGEVVMGNMGSEQRMEHTVIGSVVNLAARLCSAARPGEVVVTREILEPTAGRVELGEHTTESIEAKGFEGPVQCVRLRPVTLGGEGTGEVRPDPPRG